MDGNPWHKRGILLSLSYLSFNKYLGYCNGHLWPIFYDSAQSSSHQGNLTMSFLRLQTFNGFLLLLAVTGYDYRGFYYGHCSPSDVALASFSNLIFCCSQLHLSTSYPYFSDSQISLTLWHLTCYSLCLEHVPLLSIPSSQKTLCPGPGQLLPTYRSGCSLRAMFPGKPFLTTGNWVQHLWFTHIPILSTSSIITVIMLCATCVFNCLAPSTDS